MTTIALRSDSDTRLGGTVYFDCAGIPKNVANPRVQVLAFDEHGDLIYGETGSLVRASGFDPVTGLTGFQLGGAPGQGSLWAQSGGPAHCVATCFEFGKAKGQQVFVALASCSFEAAG